MLQQTGGGRPSQSSLRRALSTAYYAMFHALAQNGADMLVGAGPDLRASPSWQNVYRSLEHARARQIFLNSTVMAHFPPAIQEFGDTFVEMQGNRHDADYNPHKRFTKSSVVSAVDNANQRIAGFKDAGREDLRALALCIFFKPRNP